MGTKPAGLAKAETSTKLNSMNNISRFLVTLTVSLTAACAQKAAKPSAAPPTGFFVGYKSTPQDKQRDAALNKSKVVLLGSDELTINVHLQLPEVSIPVHENLARKTGTQFDKDDGIHPINGHICLQGDVKSKEQKEYSKTVWSADLLVNGKKASNTLTAVATPILDLKTGQQRPLVGRTQLRLCTDKKFFKGVNKVKMVLKAGKKKLAEMDWSSPWPTTEIGEPEPFNFGK
ncbi:hypothetical protein AB1A79_04280 [Bdellovibrio bacteriovorus]|uniref:hypothetical protein n=1 Tax=Bdellovibrio bacteriovorus TaxID=959 RepID=UPI00345B59D7